MQNQINTIKENEIEPDWIANNDFEKMDVRLLDGYYFPEILIRAGEVADIKGLKIIQDSNPTPVINLLKDKGWKFFTKIINDSEFHTYFIHQKGF